jgi:hydroxymethylglutaryl-CoA reductase (NADPH)
MGCAGPGKVYRLAQLVAATALALEISASAAMATAGSENFFRAHFERGGSASAQPGRAGSDEAPRP